MGFDVVAEFEFKNERFEVWVRDEFEATEGVEGWIEIRIADQKKYGVYRLFVFGLAGPELILWINEQVHGQRFTWQFIDRCFDEVCVYLDEKFGLIQLQEIIGVSLKYKPPETDDPVKALEQIEESLAEPGYIDILF